MVNIKAFDLPQQIVSDDHDPIDIKRLIASEINEAEGDPLKVIPGEGGELSVSIDSEWWFNPDTGQNEIICYTAVVDAGGIEQGYVVYTDGPEKSKRLSLEKFLGNVVHQTKKDGLIPVWPKRIVVYCHFMRADIVNFNDFWGAKKSTQANSGTVTSSALKFDQEGDDVG